MNTTVRLSVGLLILSMITAPALSRGEEDPAGSPVLVGRFALIEGSVLRYVPEENEWTAVTEDSPFGFNDRVRSEAGSRAEIIMPNNTWVRVGEETEIDLVSLTHEETGMFLSHGTARFINKGVDPGFTVTTPFGEITAPGATTFDLSINNESAALIPLSGSVYFKHPSDAAAIEVKAGSNGIIADQYSIAAGKGRMDTGWNVWNTERDTLWARRMGAGAQSAQHLPPALHDHAHVLQENGVWESVHYDGGYGTLWRPVHVLPGWSPFAVGSWTVWYGDHVWMPAEPFGYVTHHYGSWVLVHGRWYWAPPLASVIAIGTPRWRMGFAWYPGRVGWIYSPLRVGWVPLAPQEPYYCHRPWGPRSVVVKDVHVSNIRVHKYANVNHAVVVHRKDLYRADNYRKNRIQRPERNRIVHDYQAVPVINAKSSAPKMAEKRSISANRGISDRKIQRNPGSEPRLNEKLVGNMVGSKPDTNRGRTQPTASQTQAGQAKVQTLPGLSKSTAPSTNPVPRAPTDRAISIGNGKGNAKASKDVEKGRENSPRQNRVKPQPSVRNGRLDTDHRLAPVQQNKSDSDGNDKIRRQLYQRFIGSGQIPERTGTRSDESRSGKRQTERLQNHVQNQVKKDSGRNPQKEELKKSDRGQRRPLPKV